MDIIIKTGFQKITHELVFQPMTVPKGIKLVKAEHVQNVVEHRKNGLSSEIEARVIRQTSVTSEPYYTKLSIDASRLITSTSCNCVYNKSGKCKHVAALIHYVNNINSVTKTDMEQQWGKRSAKRIAQEKYSKGRYISEMFLPRQREKTVAVGPRPVDASELVDDCPLKTVLLSESKGECELTVKMLMHDLLNNVEVIIKKEECATCVKSLFALNQNFAIYGSEQQIDIQLAIFYEKTIVLTEEQIVELCCDTLEQSNSDTWFAARKIRLSASKNVHSIKSRITKSEDSLVQEMLFPRKVETASTKYGVKNETKAREEYNKLFNVCVQQLGVLICKYQPWLCASVDGIVYKEKNVIKIVEIKCPSSCEKKSIIDWDLKKSNVNYLQLKDSKVILRSSSAYYTQCQIQMYVCGLSVCDLFIYSPVPNSCVNITVIRDEGFLKKVITKCESFYFQCYLPALYNKSVSKEKSSNHFALKDITNQI